MSGNQVHWLSRNGDAHKRTPSEKTDPHEIGQTLANLRERLGDDHETAQTYAKWQDGTSPTS